MDLSQIQAFTNNAGIGALYTGQNQAAQLEETKAKAQELLARALVQKQAEERARLMMPAEIELRQAQAEHARAQAEYSRKGLLPYQQILKEREQATMPALVREKEAGASSAETKALTERTGSAYDYLATNAKGLAGLPPEIRQDQVNNVFKQYGLPIENNVATGQWAADPVGKADEWVNSNPAQRQKIAQEHVRGGYQVQSTAMSSEARLGAARLQYQATLAKINANPEQALYTELKAMKDSIASGNQEEAELHRQNAAMAWNVFKSKTDAQTAARVAAQTGILQYVGVPQQGPVQAPGGAGGTNVESPVPPAAGQQPSGAISPQGEEWIKRAMEANPGMSREQIIVEGKKRGKL